ncbi:uncharacterized protein LOC144111090 [Amblyomma americanum]
MAMCIFSDNKMTSVALLSILLFTFVVEAVGPMDPFYPHLHCVRRCNPLLRGMDCPVGCLCFPETNRLWSGTCLDPIQPIPPGHGPRLHALILPKQRRRAVGS